MTHLHPAKASLFANPTYRPPCIIVIDPRFDVPCNASIMSMQSWLLWPYALCRAPHKGSSACAELAPSSLPACRTAILVHTEAWHAQKLYHMQSVERHEEE